MKMETLRRAQIALGGLVLIIFLVTGTYMMAEPPVWESDAGKRMMYRSTHVYILFAALLNFLTGLLATHPGWERTQHLARGMLMLAPVTFVAGFFYQSAHFNLPRPLSFWGVVLCLAGTLLLGLARVVPLMRWPRASQRVEPVVRAATGDDLARLQEIRRAAFSPVFTSFRRMLGAEIYEVAQQHEEAAQGELLASLVRGEPNWQVLVAQVGGEIVGFVSIRLDTAKQVGEIGLNAVHPTHHGLGIGTYLYERALAVMSDAGMRVATVGTGLDASHAAARAAYRKVGFAVGVPSVWLCRAL